MKKVILMVAMVFATSGLVNANSSEDNKKACEELEQLSECDRVYNRTRDFVHGMTGSLHIGITAAIAAEEACLEREEELEYIG